jgi:uncharacterized protein with NAD-binding domain and iron-sulfur cluster
VVIGGGVAGLTAAHELVDRGYEVEVVEARADMQAQLEAKAPMLGGLARTSWARVRQPISQVPLTVWVPPVANSPEPVSAKVVDEAFDTDGQKVTQLRRDDLPLSIVVSLELLLRRGTDGDPDAVRAIEKLLRLSASEGRRLSLIAIVMNPVQQGLTTVIDSLGKGDNAKALGDWIKQKLQGRAVTLSVVAAESPKQESLQIGLEGDRVPGEHGFRFFPSFYAHMFDTMRRIPIPEASLATPIVRGRVLQADSSRSVFDNLVPARSLEMAYAPIDGTRRAFNVPRAPITSLETARRVMANMLERAGYRGGDLARISARYLEYLTSCPERRRAEYEEKPWSAFLGLDDGTFSAYFAGQLSGSAQALVAMSAEKNDARTIGSVAMQLVLDQIRTGPCTDGLLNGPTTTALFDPWQNYLQSEGVTFTQASLIGFEGHGMAVRPVFARSEEGTWGTVQVAPADYYVVAIPLVDFRKLFQDDAPTVKVPGVTLLTKSELLHANADCLTLENAPARKACAGESPDDIRKIFDFPAKEVDAHPDEGPLRYMCGIQFFFGHGVNLTEGHSICVDSPWGVCFLSQMQYWQDRQRGENGIRAVLSATFTRFEVKAEGTNGSKTALECSPKELAERIWRQIVEGWDTSRLGRLPAPEYFYLDENLTHEKGKWSNATPYLVNDLGTWQHRGGVRTVDDDYDYHMQVGHTVFAGTFMRTRTRLNTMEAANESGRRAANAILDHDASEAPRARLWNLEDAEAPDLLPLREFDRRIFARGGRHVLRSAVLDAALRAMPWDLMRFSFPTYPESSS